MNLKDMCQHDASHHIQSPMFSTKGALIQWWLVLVMTRGMSADFQLKYSIGADLCMLKLAVGVLSYDAVHKTINWLQ